MHKLDDFDEIVFVDFEFGVSVDGRPAPRCMVAKELRSGRVYRTWEDELPRIAAAPFRTDRKVLFVAYSAQAELACFSTLGWALPARILDLNVEHHNLTNGLDVGRKLINALAWHGLPHIDLHEKKEMQQLALRGGPWRAGEPAALMEYCESDVVALELLLPKMLPHISVRHALLRGHYVRAAAIIEFDGVPVDVEAVRLLKRHREELRREVVASVAEFGVYVGTTFKTKRFEAWLRANGVFWPRLPSGRLDLDKKTFEGMAALYLQVRPLYAARRTLSGLKKNKLHVAPDGQSRSPLWPFSSKTSRNQPSNSKHIFGLPGWMRGLIRPPPGETLAYIDWCQQEYGIAAALSGDPAMWTAYEHEDPYIKFGLDANVLPDGATATSHPIERAQLKACALGLLFGKGSYRLAMDLGITEVEAADLLRGHRAAYPTFWAWSESIVDHAMLFGWARTVFGWRLLKGRDPNPRSFMNFPMQANGAEMMRLAACYGLEAGVRICTPVHDAFLVRAPTGEIHDTVDRMRAAMAKASSVVLAGKQLRTDVQLVDADNPLPTGEKLRMWQDIKAALYRIAADDMCAGEHEGVRPRTPGQLL